MPAKNFSSRFFNLRYQKNNNEGLRCGIVVAKKIDKRSTVRNRLKRIFSEALKKVLEEKNINFDLVFFLKKESVGKNFFEIQKEMEEVLINTAVI